MDEFNNLIDKLNANKGKQKHDIEIEARIKKQLVNETSVQLLLKDESFNWQIMTYNEQKTSVKSKRKCTYRKRYYDNFPDEIICKSSLMKLEVNDIWCTIYVSTEVSALSMSEKLNNLEPVSITRYRGQIDDYYVDVTHSDIYRVEVEAINSQTFTYNNMVSVVSKVCKILQNSPRFFGYYDWKVISHIVKSRYGSKFNIENREYQKPYTMVYKDILHIKNNTNKWKVTPKIDGIRCFVIVIGNSMFSFFKIVSAMSNSLHLLQPLFFWLKKIVIVSNLLIPAIQNNRIK